MIIRLDYVVYVIYSKYKEFTSLNISREKSFEYVFIACKVWTFDKP